MTKKSKHERRSPNLSPLAVLRPRLDGLIQNPDWSDRGIDSAIADLEKVTSGIQPSAYLPVVLRAISDNMPSNRDLMMSMLQSWLNQSDRMVELQRLVEQDLFSGDSLQLALICLQDAKISVTRNPASTFFKAFYGEDDLGSQAFLIIFWYTNSQKSRITGVNFLRDFNPPWDGAIKDSFQFPQRSPKDGIHQFVDPMNQGRVTIREVGPVEAKQLMIGAFRCNAIQSIRPSRDTINLRTVILDKLFTLPDDDQTLEFTVDELDSIFRLGKSADELMVYEKTVGRRIRMGDGKELLVMGADQMDDWQIP